MIELDDVDTFTVEESGVVTERRTPAGSTIRQRIVLAPGAHALELEHEIDWHEQQKLLKLGFGFDVHADQVAAETQFGHLYRATHTNTSWEDARFETCAHRFVHIGEPGYGVAVTNDSTYGYDAQRHTRGDGGTTTTVHLSLIRAPRYPDPYADQGEHTLKVAVRPGATIGDAVEEGYRTNLPTRVVRGDHGFAPLVEVDHPGVVVEAVKLGQRPLGRRDRPALRVARGPGRGHRQADRRCHCGVGDRSARADRHLRRTGVWRAGRRSGAAAAAAVPAGHAAFLPLTLPPDAGRGSRSGSCLQHWFQLVQRLDPEREPRGGDSAVTGSALSRSPMSPTMAG